MFASRALEWHFLAVGAASVVDSLEAFRFHPGLFQPKVHDSSVVRGRGGEDAADGDIRFMTGDEDLETKLNNKWDDFVGIEARF